MNEHRGLHRGGVATLGMHERPNPATFLGLCTGFQILRCRAEHTVFLAAMWPGSEARVRLEVFETPRGSM